MKYVAISLIRLYQAIAPNFLRKACRFEPSCSNYALEALGKYGLRHGLLIAGARICRCRPPYGGIDYP